MACWFLSFRLFWRNLSKINVLGSELLSPMKKFNACDCLGVDHDCPLGFSNTSLETFWRNRHRRIAEIDVYTLTLDISLLLCCQLVPNCFNQWGILDSTWHRYPTHILSPNHCHRMCLCQGIGTEESLKSTFIHKGSTFHCLYAVNLCPTASIIDIWDRNSTVFLCSLSSDTHNIPKTSIVTWYTYTQNLNYNTVYVYGKLEF